jgi:hypothetical protein
MLFFHRFRVVSATTNHGRSHCTISFCVYGFAASKFLITVNLQDYIFPHGRTYSINVFAMVRNRITTSSDHVCRSLCDS